MEKTVEIVILAMIAAFLGLRLYSVLGRRAEREEQPRLEPKGEAPARPARPELAERGAVHVPPRVIVPGVTPAIERGIREIAALYAGLFDGAESAELTLDPKRKAYVHLIRGSLDVNGTQLAAGDAAALEGEARIALSQGHDAEVLVFDLAP